MNGDLREIIQHGMKRCGMGTPDLRKSVEQGHEALVEVCEDLVKSLWGGGRPKIHRTLFVHKEGQQHVKEGHREGSFIRSGGTESGGGRPGAVPIGKGDEKRCRAHRRAPPTERH